MVSLRFFISIFSFLLMAAVSFSEEDSALVHWKKRTHTHLEYKHFSSFSGNVAAFRKDIHLEYSIYLEFKEAKGVPETWVCELTIFNGEKTDSATLKISSGLSYEVWESFINDLSFQTGFEKASELIRSFKRGTYEEKVKKHYRDQKRQCLSVALREFQGAFLELTKQKPQPTLALQEQLLDFLGRGFLASVEYHEFNIPLALRSLRIRLKDTLKIEPSFLEGNGSLVFALDTFLKENTVYSHSPQRVITVLKDIFRREIFHR